MLRGYSFRPSGWALALAAAGCTLFVLLGNWQARRAEEKRALAEAFDQALRSPPIVLAPGAQLASVLHKHVTARGRFVPEHTVFLDNRLRRGRPGYEVVTPLHLAGSDSHVLVDRGWVAAPPSRAALPTVYMPAGELAIGGIALDRLAHALETGAAPQGNVRQNLDIAAFAAETKLKLEPYVIEQRSETPDNLSRDWPRPDFGIEKHESYSLQWYSFAALAVILVIVLSMRRAPAN
ncbi:MAG: SURF1 family protein [Betaproteobacteria bacterium]|nr:SURF1 family protein [Betaproteobacteria bacterium]